MKTNHPDYEETFERVVNERDEARLAKTKETGIAKKNQQTKIGAPGMPYRAKL